MNKETLRELCREALRCKSGRKATTFAMKLRRLFNITEEEVRATQVEKYVKDETLRFAQQTVKAAFLRLRKELWEYATTNSIVTVGKKLPRVGYWANGEDIILSGVTNTFMFKTGSRGHTDPLSNEGFIALL